MTESDVWNNHIIATGLSPLLRQILLRMKFDYDADSFALFAVTGRDEDPIAILKKPANLYEPELPKYSAAFHAIKNRAAVLGEVSEVEYVKDPPCRSLPGSAIGLRICKYRLTKGSPVGRRFVLAVPLCSEESYERHDLLSGDFVGVVEFHRPDQPFDDEDAALLLLQGRQLGAVLEHALQALKLSSLSEE